MTTGRSRCAGQSKTTFSHGKHFSPCPGNVQISAAEAGTGRVPPPRRASSPQTTAVSTTRKCCESCYMNSSCMHPVYAQTGTQKQSSHSKFSYNQGGVKLPGDGHSTPVPPKMQVGKLQEDTPRVCSDPTSRPELRCGKSVHRGRWSVHDPGPRQRTRSCSRRASRCRPHNPALLGAALARNMPASGDVALPTGQLLIHRHGARERGGVLGTLV